MKSIKIIIISVVIGLALVLATFSLTRTVSTICYPDTNFGLDVVGFSDGYETEVLQHGLPLSYFNTPTEGRTNRDCDGGLNFVMRNFLINWIIISSMTFIVVYIVADLRKIITSGNNAN